MNETTRKEIATVLEKSKRNDLAKQVSAASPSDQVAEYLNGMVNQVRKHLRTVGGQMYYYTRGEGHESLDDNERRLMDRAKKKLDVWEKQQLKALVDIANDVKKI